MLQILYIMTKAYIVILNSILTFKYLIILNINGITITTSNVDNKLSPLSSIIINF